MRQFLINHIEKQRMRDRVLVPEKIQKGLSPTSNARACFPIEISSFYENGNDQKQAMSAVIYFVISDVAFPGILSHAVTESTIHNIHMYFLHIITKNSVVHSSYFRFARNGNHGIVFFRR